MSEGLLVTRLDRLKIRYAKFPIAGKAYSYYLIPYDEHIFDNYTESGIDILKRLIDGTKYPYAIIDMSIRDYWNICAKFHIVTTVQCLYEYRLNVSPLEICLFADGWGVDFVDFAVLAMANDCTDFGVIIEHIVEYAKFHKHRREYAYAVINNILRTLNSRAITMEHIHMYLSRSSNPHSVIKLSECEEMPKVNLGIVKNAFIGPRKARAMQMQLHEYGALLRERALCVNMLWHFRAAIRNGHKRSAMMYICVHALLRAYEYNDSEVWAIMHGPPDAYLGSVISRLRQYGE